MLLVTTALKETWGDTEDIIFLGEWCKLYSEKSYWQKRTHQTLSYGWDDRKKLAADYFYLTDLYERLLPLVSEALNKIHHTTHSEKYWRILIGPWLGFFIQIVFQRWSSILDASGKFPISNTIVLTNKDFCLVPDDMLAFAGLFSGDLWNHYICGRIIQYQKKIPFEILSNHAACDEVAKKKENSSISYRLKIRFLSIWNKCLSPLATDRDLFVIATGLPKLKEMRLKLELGQVPQYAMSERLSSVPLSTESRRWQLEDTSGNDFESFVKKIIPHQIPKSYVEAYAQACDRTLQLKWPKSPKLIFTSVGHVYDDLAKTYISDKVEQGALLTIGQHGGGPFHALNFQTDHELKICDSYLSPGSGNTWHPKVRSVGQLFSRRWHAKSGGMGLLIQLGTPRYSFSMSSTTQSDDFNKYMEEQMRFAAKLPPCIRKCFAVRLNVTDNGWGNVDRWREGFPDIAVDLGHKDIHALFSESNIVVCTYAGTTYNQTLAANAPTVIFWNSKYEELHPTAELSFKELARVGIFHSTPESAADHIAKVWDSVHLWWKSADVQAARQQYCQRYAYLPDHSLNLLSNQLRDAVEMRQI